MSKPQPKISRLLTERAATANHPAHAEDTGHPAPQPTETKHADPSDTKRGFPPFGRDLFSPADSCRIVQAEPTGRDSAILGPPGGADARTDAETGRAASFEIVRAATSGKRAGCWWMLAWLLLLLLAALSASWTEMGGALRIHAP